VRQWYVPMPAPQQGQLISSSLALGIPRQLQGISGWDAVLLWQRYQNYGDQNALELLLQYNKEDMVNLKVLRERLGLKD
jgi:uncharacterized protein YprB with RNaseH-like and TPR domain